MCQPVHLAFSLLIFLHLCCSLTVTSRPLPTTTSLMISCTCSCRTYLSTATWATPHMHREVWLLGQVRCKHRMESPSSWKVVKLVFLRKPDAARLKDQKLQSNSADVASRKKARKVETAFWWIGWDKLSTLAMDVDEHDTETQSGRRKGY